MNDRTIPKPASEVVVPEEVLTQVFARLDAIALGVALGIVVAAVLFALTIALVLKGGDPLGPNLSLLGHYIPGYSVSWTGSIFGAVGGFVAGFSIGWMIAFLRNLILSVYIRASAFLVRLNRFFDDL